MPRAVQGHVGPPSILYTAAVGVGIAAAATAIRALLEAAVGGLAPFALVFPAVLCAAVVGRTWAAGAICLVLSLAAATTLFHHPSSTAVGILNPTVIGASAGLLLVILELHQRELARLRRGAEEKSRDRQRLQTRLLDDAHGLMAVLRGPDLEISYANASFQALLGGGPDLEARAFATLTPRPAPETLAALRHVLESGQGFEVRDFVVKGGPAQGRRLDLRCAPILGADGRPEAVFIEGIDITDARNDQAALADRETRLRLAVEAGQIGIWDWRIETGEMIYSPEARAICGFPTDTSVTYDMVVAATHPDDLPITRAQAARALDPAIRDTAEYEYRIVRPDGSLRWVSARGQALFEARPEGPIATRYVGTLIDVTEARTAAQAVRDSEHRLHVALQAGRMGMWQVDPEGRLHPSPTLNAVLGLAPDASPTLADLEPSFLPGEIERVRSAAEAARRSGQAHFEVEYRYRMPDGEVHWLSARAEAGRRTGHVADGMIGVVTDITERKADEERLQLLMREVDHRANNLMSIIQGTVLLSRAGSAEELRKVILGRLDALGRAHQLMADSRWDGANLRRLIEEETLPYTFGDSQRVRLDGPDVALTPALAQGLAMTLHELGTNAVKYGALSVPGGHVRIEWRHAGERLDIRWTEQGGPDVSPPSRTGFGARVLARALGGTIGGSCRTIWRREGLVCELQAPLAATATSLPARDRHDPAV